MPSLLMAFVTTIIAASPLYATKLPGIIAYYGDPKSLHRSDFLPHTLGPVVSWDTVSRYFDVLLGQLGWPAALLIVVGILWTCYQLVHVGPRRLANDWKTMSLLLPLSSGMIMLIVAVMVRSRNTRFFSPALVPWGVLAGLAMSSLWMQRRFIGRAFVLIILLFLVVFWWSQSLGPVLPNVLTFLPQRSFMRPIDVEPIPEALDVIEAHLRPSSEVKIWVVGSNSRFNSPVLSALIMERGYAHTRLVNSDEGLWSKLVSSFPYFQTWPLYIWHEDPDLGPILNRLVQGEWVVAYESIAVRPDLFTEFDIEMLRPTFDNEILQWLHTHPDFFELVSKLESSSANNRIWIFKRNHDGSKVPLDYPCPYQASQQR